jgi:anti-sigma regulatory factor (Ser/Thr protein kinase)
VPSVPNPLVRGFDHSSDFSDVAVARRFVREALADVDPAISADLQLAVSELMTNAIEHAAGPHVTVEVAIDVGEVVLTVTSHGSGPLAPVTTWEPARPEASAGRGLAIVRSVATNVTVEHVGDTLRISVHRAR